MKKEFKNLVLGMLIGGTAVGAIPTVAKDARDYIEVTYRNIKIYADGNLVDTTGNEAFIYNGTTYLPVRAVGNAFNKAIDWDGANSSVYIGKRPTTVGTPTVLIENLDYFTKDGMFSFRGLSDSGKDNVGDIHSSGVSTDDQGKIQYLVNAQYRRIKGTVGTCFSERDDSDVAIFKIYGDGKLLFSSRPITAGNVPESFDVDITGVISLTLETSFEKHSHSVELYDCGLYS
ncbi:MAG: NPCBM/NEW2 domain-containing protein [Firmicutes bacterium]|nr:NPCBM/NEW2 domain-containing protein [Bacillota bacterium]